MWHDTYVDSGRNRHCPCMAYTQPVYIQSTPPYSLAALLEMVVVCRACIDNNVPLVITMGGGYSIPMDAR